MEPVTTVRFEQKVSLPNYESATISITVSNIPEDAPRNYIRGMVATGEVAIDVLREVVEAKINQIRKPLSPERAEELNTRINALTAPAVNPLLAPVENPLLASTPEPVPEPAPVPTPEASQPDPDDVIPSLDDEPQNFGKGLVTFGHPFGGYEFAPGEGTGLLSSEPNRMRQLNSLMARTGFTDYRHQLAGVVFGRRIASLNEITIREAEVLSDFLLHASDDQKKTALGAARK